VPSKRDRPGASRKSARRLITISRHAERWHGRNLALELVVLGYPNVSWYRGGLEAWDAAGLPVRRLSPTAPDRLPVLNWLSPTWPESVAAAFAKDVR
jgi:3-mercaptopyruvate sulfurtransferase SseA